MVIAVERRSSTLRVGWLPAGSQLLVVVIGDLSLSRLGSPAGTFAIDQCLASVTECDARKLCSENDFFFILFSAFDKHAE